MAKRIRHLIYWLVAAYILGGFCLAQPSEPPPVAELNFYIAAQSRFKGIHFGTYDEEGQLIDSTELKFKTSGRSDEYVYEGPLPLVFFEEEPQPTPENPDAVKRTPVASISPPLDLKETFILFQNSNEESNLKYKTTWVDLGSQAIPAGHLGILNLTPTPFQGVVGNGRDNQNEDAIVFTVNPGINPAVKIHPVGNLIFALQTERYGWLTIYEDKFFCRADEKYLLVVFPPRVRGSVSVGAVIIPFEASSETNPEEVQN